MRNKLRDKGQEFYEAMPGTMQSPDRSMMRSMLPWLIVPAVAVLGKVLWNITSDRPGMQNMRNKMKEMPEKIKSSAQNMMKRDEKPEDSQ